MSKNTEVTTRPEYSGWGNAHLLFEDTMSRLVGRLLTHIEAWGLPPAQEKAVKSIIRKEVYATLDDAWIIGDADHAMLRKNAYDFGQLSMGGHHPSDLPHHGNSQIPKSEEF
jgi:hypothetical protein